MDELTDEIIKKFLSSETVKNIQDRSTSQGVSHTVSISVLSMALGKSVEDEDTVKKLVEVLRDYIDENIVIEIMWAEGLLKLTKIQTS